MVSALDLESLRSLWSSGCLAFGGGSEDDENVSVRQGLGTVGLTGTSSLGGMMSVPDRGGVFRPSLFDCSGESLVELSLSSMKVSDDNPLIP